MLSITSSYPFSIPSPLSGSTTQTLSNPSTMQCFPISFPILISPQPFHFLLLCSTLFSYILQCPTLSYLPPSCPPCLMLHCLPCLRAMFTPSSHSLLPHRPMFHPLPHPPPMLHPPHSLALHPLVQCSTLSLTLLQHCTPSLPSPQPSYPLVQCSSPTLSSNALPVSNAPLTLL